MTLRAADLYQTFLDSSSKIFWARDFEGLAAMMVYPHTMETLDGDLRFDTTDQMIEAGHEFRGYLDRMQAQDYVRLCKSAHFVPGREDQIIGVHESYVMRGGTYVVDPYRNEMCLEWHDGSWKGAGIRAQVSNVDVPILSPKQLRDRTISDANDRPKE